MSKRSFRIALVVVLASLVLAGGVAAYVVTQALGYPSDRRAGTGAKVRVTIEPGMSFPRIARRLADKGVIDNPRWFRLYAMKRGVTTMVKVGDYVLRDDRTPEEVLDRLLEGVEDLTVQVAVPEGLNMLEVFAIIGQRRRVDKDGVSEEVVVANAADLERVARDPAFLRAHGITGDTVEGHLFPETYRFKVPSRPELVLETMIKQHRIVWDRIRRDRAQSIQELTKKLGWTDRDILTMASIVEKEAVIDSERPRIAQVFINRLIAPGFSPRRLDTDPTIRYGCTVPTRKSAACLAWDKSDRLHRAQLDDADNPYNTYQHEGLPPGPICNPGERSLAATVDPDGSGYFFFVARSATDHSHNFARTREEHQRNVDAYVRGH